jgi:hypothetical protein
MNLFEDYAKQAQSIMDRPTPLVGVIKRRGDARTRYTEIVAALNACLTPREIADYLGSISAEIIQFQAELEYYWEGDGDFAGLSREIERAQVRVDERLDYPRYEEKEKAQ